MLFYCCAKPGVYRELLFAALLVACKTFGAYRVSGSSFKPSFLRSSFIV